MIRFTDVSKFYPGKIPGIVDLSVEIPDGEFVFLIGPSGSGKTTILRLLIRDLLPTSGNIVIDEYDLKKLTPKNIHLLRRKVGIVFQDFKLLMDRTVYENVAMVLEILGKPVKDIPDGVKNVLELVGLLDKKDVFPIQLSAGEMQRVSIARAIAGRLENAACRRTDGQPGPGNVLGHHRHTGRNKPPGHDRHRRQP